MCAFYGALRLLLHQGTRSRLESCAEADYAQKLIYPRFRLALQSRAESNYVEDVK